MSKSDVPAIGRRKKKSSKEMLQKNKKQKNKKKTNKTKKLSFDGFASLIRLDNNGVLLLKF